MSKFEIEFKWAVYFIILLFIWFYVEKILGLHDQNVKWEGLFSLMVIIPQAVLYHLALKTKKNQFYKGKISWKQAFFSGAIISLIIAGLSPIVSYTTTAVISPDFMENFRQQSGQSRDVFSANQFATSMLFSLLSNGIVISAIIAILIKRKEN
jgi:hypothetical protein